jgi:hypothetical protein
MSTLETVEFTELDDIWKPGRHTLVVGQPRSGKTSWLLTITMTFFLGGEWVIVRDIGEYYEWFSLLRHKHEKKPNGFEILGHVPKDCRVVYNHRNFEQVEFDITKPATLFDNLDRERINLLFVESFTMELRNIVRFWTSFFRTILRWKQRPGNGAKRFCLIMDEFGDIAPGKGRTFLPAQNRMSQLIAVNHRKFRRHNIRLEAAVHYFRDITPPIRERFDCYIINKNYPNEKEVPFTLRTYAHDFPKLDVSEIYFLDSSKGYNKMKVREEVKPRRFYDISVEGLGRADTLIAGTKQKSKWEKIAAEWKRRALVTGDELITTYGWTIPNLAHMWGISKRMLQFHRESIRKPD